MRDKVVLQHTKDGMVEKNLATGESRLVAESDYAKEGKFKLIDGEKQYHSPYEQPARHGLTEKPGKIRKISPKRQHSSRWNRLPNENSRFASVREIKGRFETYLSGKRPESGGTKENKNIVRNFPSVRPGANRQAFTGYLERGRLKGEMGTVTHSPPENKGGSKSSGTNRGEGYIGFNNKTGRVEFLPCGAVDPAGSVSAGVKALPSMDRQEGGFPVPRERGKSIHRFLREVFRKQIRKRGKSGEGEENLGTQTVDAVFRTGDRVRFGVHNLKRFGKFILRHPALVKFLLGVAAVFGGILLLFLLIYGLFGGFFGSAVEHPELTAYVQQLDTNFLNKINSVKASYEQGGYVVTVEGDENIATDPGALAVLVTKEWTGIDLTPENKNKLAQYHAVLNSYTVSFYDETVEEGKDGKSKKIVHHADIIVHACNAEEKIDAFGFTSAEKSQILEMLGLLYEIESESGTSISGSGSVSGNVLAYRPLVSQYCTQYGISGYTNLALAVMQQESGGSGSDPMQCSECGYNTRYPHTPGSINDPAYSIQCGVHYLADCLKAAKCKSPSDTQGISLALQGYNFGSGYIAWAFQRGGYSQSNAVEFSRMEAREAGSSVYGDVNYVSHVLRYYNAMQSGNFIWPLPGHTYISSGYGSRVDPITRKAGAFHTGIDIPAPTGTSVLAAASGKVILSGWYGGYGNCVIIQHANGIQTLYGHNSALLIKKGDTVSQGQAIAKVGQTGRATGPHCHFEVRVNGQHVDPMPYLKGKIK